MCSVTLRSIISKVGGITTVRRELCDDGFDLSWDCVANWVRRDSVPKHWLHPLCRVLQRLDPGLAISVDALAALGGRRNMTQCECGNEDAAKVAASQAQKLQSRIVARESAA